MTTLAWLCAISVLLALALIAGAISGARQAMRDNEKDHEL
jgi:hypothetical protein